MGFSMPIISAVIAATVSLGVAHLNNKKADKRLEDQFDNQSKLQKKQFDKSEEWQQEQFKNQYKLLEYQIKIDKNKQKFELLKDNINEMQNYIDESAKNLSEVLIDFNYNSNFYDKLSFLKHMSSNLAEHLKLLNKTSTMYKHLIDNDQDNEILEILYNQSEICTEVLDYVDDSLAKLNKNLIHDFDLDKIKDNIGDLILLSLDLNNKMIGYLSNQLKVIYKE